MAGDQATMLLRLPCMTSLEPTSLRCPNTCPGSCSSPDVVNPCSHLAAAVRVETAGHLRALLAIRLAIACSAADCTHMEC